jgi:putative DNA methylase
VKFGEADVLARAKNTSIEGLRDKGILYAEKGVVRLLTREEIAKSPTPRAWSIHDEKTIWLLTQKVTHAFEQDGEVGAAKIVADIYAPIREAIKSFAYRLFQIAERKNWQSEALVYNSLIIAWPNVQSKVAELNGREAGGKQTTLFDVVEGK